MNIKNKFITLLAVITPYIHPPHALPKDYYKGLVSFFRYRGKQNNQDHAHNDSNESLVEGYVRPYGMIISGRFIPNTTLARLITHDNQLTGDAMLVTGKDFIS